LTNDASMTAAGPAACENFSMPSLTGVSATVEPAPSQPARPPTPGRADRSCRQRREQGPRTLARPPLAPLSAGVPLVVLLATVDPAVGSNPEGKVHFS
jgi:hypothetical protein